MLHTTQKNIATVDLRKFFAVLAIATPLGLIDSQAVADENDDVEACSNLFESMVGETLRTRDATWEPRIFGPNRLEFPSNDVVCEVALRGVVNLFHGEKILVSEGWPIGHRAVFERFKKAARAEKDRIRSQLRRLDELETEVEQSLRNFEGSPEAVFDDAQNRMLDLLKIEIPADLVDLQDELASLDKAVETCRSYSKAVSAKLDSCGVEIRELKQAARENGSRQDSLRRMSEALRGAQIEEAFQIWEARLRDEELPSEQLQEFERLALNAVQPLPARLSHLNYLGYRLLSELNPDKLDYSARRDGYLKAQDIDVCVALVEISVGTALPNANVDEVDISSPIPMRSKFLVSYRRQSDGTSWQVLCGVGENTLVRSTLSNGEPGRSWRDPNHPLKIGYTISNGWLTITESFYDEPPLKTRRQFN